MARFHVSLVLLSLVVAATSSSAQDTSQKRSSLTLPPLASPQVAVSSDGKRLLAPLPSSFSSAKVDLETGVVTNLPQRVFRPFFTKDGQRMLSGGAILDVKTGKRLVTFKGHEDRIVRSHLSIDGKFVVTGSTDKTVRVWDAQNGKELAKLTGHDKWIYSVAMDPQSKLVISGSNDSTARIWDWKTGKTLHTLTGHTGNCRFVAFSNDSKRAITLGVGGKARIWNAETGEEIALLEVPHGITHIALNPNGNQIATYNNLRDNQVRLWSWNGKSLYILDHAKPVQFAEFLADGSRLLTCSVETRIWDADSGIQLIRFEDAEHIKYSSLYPDGKRLIGSRVTMLGPQRRGLGIWDTETGKRLKTLELSDRNLRSIDMTPDGKNAIVSGYQNRAAIWDLETGERSLALQGGHAWQIWDVEFSPDGSKAATASLDQTARLWDAKTGKLIAVLSGHNDRVQYVTFSPSGKYVFSGSGPNHTTGRIWDATTGKPIQVLQGHTDKILHARFSKDEKRVLTGSEDNTARLWDVASGKELHQFKHGSTITTAEFSPDEKSILTASSGVLSKYWTTESGYRLNEGSGPSNEHSAKLWNAKTGALRAHMEHLAGVKASFTADGKQVITVSKGEIVIWSDTGKRVISKANPIANSGTTVFSPDRQRMMFLTDKSPAELWNISTLTKTRDYNLEKPFRKFFSQDGSAFYSMTHKGRFTSWDIGN